MVVVVVVGWLSYCAVVVVVVAMSSVTSPAAPSKPKSFENRSRYERFHQEGYLDKKASQGVGARWQTRYFRVVNHLLVYTDRKESPPEGIHKVFDLTRMNELVADPDDKTQCKFLVGFKGVEGLLHLRGASPADCQKWIQQLTDRQTFLEEEALAKLNIQKSAEEGQIGKPQSLERATIGLRFAIDNLHKRNELSTAMLIAARAGIGLKSTLYTEAETKLASLPPDDGSSAPPTSGSKATAPAPGIADDSGSSTAASSPRHDAAVTVNGEVGAMSSPKVEQSAEDQFFNVLDNEPVQDTDFERFLKEIGVSDYVGIANLLESNNFVDPETLSVLEPWQLELLGVPVDDIQAIASSEVLKECRAQAARSKAPEGADGGAAASNDNLGEAANAKESSGENGAPSHADPCSPSAGASGFAQDLHSRTGRATVWRCLQAGAHVRDKPMGQEVRKLEMGEIITQAVAGEFADNRLWIGFYDDDRDTECAVLRWTVTTNRKDPTKLKLEPLIESKHSAIVSKGANVEVKYGAGQGNWTKATVVAINSDDTLTVRYRDGEVERAVKQANVRVSVEARNAVEASISSSDATLLRGSCSTKPLPSKDRLVKGVDYHVKLTSLLLGNSNVGKSSMMQRYVTGEFQANQMNTIGIDHREVLVEDHSQNDENVTLLSIWDTAGQERFANLSRNYVRRMDCLLLCFDITDAKSFAGIDKWTSFLQENVDTSEKVVFLVGTKCDLEHDRVIPRNEAEALAARLEPLLGEVPYFECSAKTGHSIGMIFESLVPFWSKMHGDKRAPSERHGTGGTANLGGRGAGEGTNQRQNKCC